VPGPRTMFEGIRKLPPGHLLVQEGDGTPRVTPYWDFPPQPAADDPVQRADPARLKADLAARLEDAVRATMESDVPVGAFLSGGIDSGVVVALMSRCASGPVRTFSIGFRERSYNELPYARQVAERYGTEHTELVVEPHVEDVIEHLVDAFDEPFADSSAIATWYVSQAAAGHTKVVLSGDGGDEVFGGYVIYQADRLAGLYRRLPRWLGEGLVPAVVDRLPASQEKMSFDLKARRFVTHARRDPVSAHAGWRVIFTDEMKAALYGSHPAPDRDSLDVMRDVFAAYGGADTLNRFLVVDARVSLVDDMLTKVDRTSMAHSLEVRVPLLDHQLVEWMTRVPSRFKVRRLALKHLFRAVARDLLPVEVANRPKAGFHVPVPLWLKTELRPLVERQLGRPTVVRQGVFDPEPVQRLWSEHLSGRRDHSRNLWGLLMFSLWYDRHIAGS
jgi:asparagine synthase (glutamine-hydrolysing)